nr:hypothetical protein [Tanacetum cinerariifolium]
GLVYYSSSLSGEYTVLVVCQIVHCASDLLFLQWFVILGRGKENEVNILKSIDEGPFQMGMFRETLAEGEEGALYLGPEQPQVYSDLSPEEEHQFNADIRATNILLQGLTKDIYTLINHYTDAKDIGLRDSNYDQLYAYLKHYKAHANENKMMLDRFTQNTIDPLALMSNVSHQQYYLQSSTTLPSTSVQPHFADNTQLDLGLSPTDNLIENLTNTLALLTQSYKTYLPQTNNQLRTSSNTRNQATENEVALDAEQLLFITGGQDNVVDEDVDEQLVQDLALNVDNVFQADEYPIYDEAGPSYDSDILSEVHDHDHYQDAVCKYHEVHEMHDDVQPNYFDDSHADYMSDSNTIPYDQYVKDNVVPIVQSNVSYVPNDAYIMILHDMHEQPAQRVSVTTQNNVVDKSLAAKLATYKEQVELYERQAKFALTEREQKIDEHIRIVITDRNIKEENLKKELQSIKIQLTSTINHNK